MKIVKASYKILSIPSSLELIELAGRTCYKSEEKIAEETWRPFIEMLIQRGHESVLEHLGMTVKFIVDRGVSHELVRHRLASYSQESTRYSSQGKGGELTFIAPCFWEADKAAMVRWESAMWSAEKTYLFLISTGARPQEARSVLPNSLKTEIVVTANLREWRHILQLRTSSAAHPQMREVMEPLLGEVKKRLSPVFDDIGV